MAGQYRTPLPVALAVPGPPSGYHPGRPAVEEPAQRDTDKLRELVGDLIELPAGKWAKLALADDLRAAVDEARRLTAHSAKKRQIRFIGGLFDEADEQAIRADLKAMDHGGARPRV